MRSDLKSVVDKTASPKSIFFLFLAVSVVFFVWKYKTFNLRCQNGKQTFKFLIAKSVKLLLLFKLPAITVSVDIRTDDLLRKLKDVIHLSISQEILLEKYIRNEDYYISPVIIYAITPTYSRYVQKAELTRISQTLRLVPNVHWIVVEDSNTKTQMVTRLLFESNLVYTHLNHKTLPPKTEIHKKHKGVDQRNEALKWLRKNLIPTFNNGVVYFMDDDNTYSTKLFEEISKVKKVGVWPVGLVAGYNVETAVVDSKSGKVKGFKTGWKARRKFALDMASFAINLELILRNKKALFSHKTATGYLENDFLKHFVTKLEDLEPLANNCTDIYVWHTRTVKPLLKGSFPGYEV